MDTVETFALSVIHLLIFLQNFAPGPGVPSCLVTGGPLLSFLTPATTITPAEPRQQPPGNTVSGDVKLVTISLFRPAANAIILPAGGISLTSSVQIVARAGLHWAGERRGGGNSVNVFVCVRGKTTCPPAVPVLYSVMCVQCTVHHPPRCWPGRPVQNCTGGVSNDW